MTNKIIKEYIFKLINKQRQELIKKIEKHSVFTYPKDSNERIITFSMSEKIWKKEFKE